MSFSESESEDENQKDTKNDDQKPITFANKKEAMDAFKELLKDKVQVML